MYRASLTLLRKKAVCCIKMLLPVFLTIGFGFAWSARADDFRVDPYLQNPAQDAMTVMWFSQANTAGSISYSTESGPDTVMYSTPVLASALSYHSSEPGPNPGTPYLHQVRLTGLSTGKEYSYTVTQGTSERTNQFSTAPSGNKSVRFMLYSDSETEPESTGSRVTWDVPTGVTRPAMYSDGKYLVDQTTGYAENIKVMAARNPDFIVISGDLAQAGGEQRDWDEFWRHNAGSLNNIASRVPIMAAPGNHENYGGTAGSYTNPAPDNAMAKYLTYFDAPSNGATDPDHEGRYYRIDYGPVTIISLDVCDGLPDDSSQDTNFYLAGTNAPDFNPGSEQAAWLETQLADAQQSSQFTFISFHHVPYSVGPHGYPTGTGSGYDNQSGVPVRALMDMFHQYGVDALLCGHDEMLERSELEGTEQLPGGGTSDHTMHVYDYGVGGDGLRGPQSDLTNPEQEFLAHTNAPEIWSGNQLVDGGKHYGHLEVNVEVNDDRYWQTTFTPVYVFPLMDANGNLLGTSERRVYDDEITILADTALIPGDFDSDGDVDVSDLGLLATYYGTPSGASWAMGDANRDGAVDVSDLGLLATYYGTTAAGVVPEPGMLTLLGCGLLGLLACNWRKSR